MSSYAVIMKEEWEGESDAMVHCYFLEKNLEDAKDHDGDVVEQGGASVQHLPRTSFLKNPVAEISLTVIDSTRNDHPIKADICKSNI